MGVVALATYLGNRFIDLHIPSHRVFFLCAIVTAANAALHYYYFLRKEKDSFLNQSVVAGTTYVQFALDFVFITFAFHYSGGIAGLPLLYFPFHVILSGLLLEKRRCFLYVFLITLAITVIALLELTGILPHRYASSLVPREVQDNPFFALIVLFLFNLVIWVSIPLFVIFFDRLHSRILHLIDFEQKLKQANQQLGLLNQFAKDTTSTLGFYPRLNLVCHRVMKMMGLKGVAIRILDERTNLLELAAACGLSEAYLNKGPVDADKSLAKALAGEPHFVLDAPTDPAAQYPEDARREGIVSMLSFPLEGRERIIGTIRLYTGETRVFSRNELDFIGALSSQAAVSIENAKIYDTQKRQDEAKSEFIMMMTHELKGPLMAMRSLLEIMLKGYTGSLTEKQEELVKRVYRRIGSVVEVSKELLDIYQWQSRMPDTRFVPISLKEEIQKAVDLFMPTAQEKGLTLSVDLPREDFTLMGTGDEIETILNNLVTNAVKYTPEGGNIFLGLSHSENQVILKVKDSGIGIDPDDIPKIFSGFFRTREAKKMDPYGRGIGLPFVKKVVETLGGVISVKSDKQKGSEFCLAFPKAKHPRNFEALGWTSAGHER